MANPPPPASPAAVAVASGEPEVLSREEVLRRRSGRVKRLLESYKRSYWALAEEVRAKHREYYWEHGRSPAEEAEEEATAGNGARAEEERERERERKRCGLGGCKSYAMALTSFCHAHILLDEKQTLYKPCTYVLRSAQNGPITCGKPVLRAAVPCLCPVHFQKAQKHVSQALKKAGVNVSSSTRTTPKFHSIIAAYVRQVQEKRREASDVTIEGKQ